MSDRWSIRVDDADAQRQLRRIELGLNDLRPFWSTLTRLYRGWMAEQFSTEGAFGGSRWAALSPVYALQKQQSYPGRGILVASGAMRRAVDNPTRRQTPRSLTLTFESDILRFHEEGTARMPARPLVLGGSPLPAEAEGELALAAEGYVRDLLGRF